LLQCILYLVVSIEEVSVFREVVFRLLNLYLAFAFRDGEEEDLSVSINECGERADTPDLFCLWERLSGIKFIQLVVGTSIHDGVCIKIHRYILLLSLFLGSDSFQGSGLCWYYRFSTFLG
jgi:hypothetical protein